MRQILAIAFIGTLSASAVAEHLLLGNAQNSLTVVDTPAYDSGVAGGLAREPFTFNSTCTQRTISIGQLAYRRSDGYLYGYASPGGGSSTALYRVVPGNAVCQPIVSVGSAYANGTAVEFNADSSELRVIRYNSAGTLAENLRVNPATGAIISTETPLSWADATPGAPGLTSLTLTGDNPPRLLARSGNWIVEIGSAAGGEASWNAGLVTRIVQMNVPANQFVGGFAVSPTTGTAYLQYSQNNVGTTHVRNLATVDLSTGQLTVVSQPFSPGAHVGITRFLDANMAWFPLFCTGDANADSVTNACDLNIMLANFGAFVPPSDGFTNYGDLNDDGVVNAADLSVLLSHWGLRC